MIHEVQMQVYKHNPVTFMKILTDSLSLKYRKATPKNLVVKIWVKREDVKLGSNELYPYTPVPAGTWIRTRRMLFWNHLLAFQKSVHARVPPQENLAQVILMSNHCPNKCAWACCVPGGTA